MRVHYADTREHEGDLRGGALFSLMVQERLCRGVSTPGLASRYLFGLIETFSTWHLSAF